MSVNINRKHRYRYFVVILYDTHRWATVHTGTGNFGATDKARNFKPFCIQTFCNIPVPVPCSMSELFSESFSKGFEGSLSTATEDTLVWKPLFRFSVSLACYCWYSDTVPLWALIKVFLTSLAPSTADVLKLVIKQKYFCYNFVKFFLSRRSKRTEV